MRSFSADEFSVKIELKVFSVTDFSFLQYKHQRSKYISPTPMEYQEELGI